MEIKSKEYSENNLSDLVSIGMPVFNDIDFVRGAFRSLLNQSYENFELIVSDDCSTDGSAEVCKEMAEQDSRVRYIRQEKNIGISRNMEFLLREAKGHYFMWAGNDDLWHPDFIKILKQKLDINSKSIVSFCPYSQIDDAGNVIPEKSFVVENYDRKTDYERVKALIKERKDSFGYGLFRRAEITKVKFPVWWWVNKKCAYNNIYPTLCYYLTKGEYNFHDSVLWFKRMKSEKNINHKLPFPKHFFLGYAAFVLRKFNLVVNSFLSIVIAKPSGIFTALRVLPNLLFSWFLFPIRNPIQKYKIYRREQRLDFFI